ncbi:MAG: MBL fold metallo-hydrolase [Planctomycetes bacterium]|nr:MBL fold metallo-hydrolase [Planctomycetota bacterium]
MPSHRLAKIIIDDMDIIGYSVAGEETVVAMPQLDVCFDIGKAPDQVIPVNNLLLTHGHMDHAAGIGYYLSHRNFCGMPPARVFAPANLLEPIRQILDAWGKLDGSSVPVTLVGIKPGDEHRIKGNLYARAFPVNHNYGAVGYSIIEKRKKLKPEYTKLKGPQIVELKKQGIKIDYTLEFPIVSYMGDTSYMDFSKIDYIAKSKILIIECTFFLDEHRDRADAGKHMHIDELAGLIERMQNEHVIVTHLSQRIGIGQAKTILRKSLSAKAYKKTTLLMDRKWFL